MPEEKTEAQIQKLSGKRSPAYPALNLEEAISKARTLWDKESRNAASIEAVAAHWGYSTTASQFLLAIAALKKYALVETADEEEGMKSVRLSAMALRILLPDSEQDKQQAIQEAALKPKMHQTMWQKYKASLPSDESLTAQLIKVQNFTKSGAATFIRTYRKTISFAKLTNESTLPGGDGEKDDDEGRTDGGVPKVTPAGTLLPPMKNPVTGQLSKTIVIPLGPLGDALLQIPAQTLPKSKFEYIKRFLEMIEEQLTSEEAKGQS